MNRNTTALILVVLAIGVYFTYTSGQITTLKSIQATNAGYSSAISNAKKLIGLRDSILAKYNTISDLDKARLDKIVPSNIDNIRLIIDIAGIASRHNVTATGLTTSADTAISGAAPAAQNVNAAYSSQSSPSTVTVSFNVATTYDNFISLIQDLERSLRILDITSISLSPSVNGVYTYGVTMNTYWLNQ